MGGAGEDEGLIDAPRRELAEETGFQIAGEPKLVFEVEVEMARLIVPADLAAETA